MTKAKSKTIITSGMRKRSVARATLRPGTGRVRINSKALDVYEPYLARMKIMEPMILAGDIAKKVNIDINLNGGGIISGAEAARLAIAKALVEFSGKESLREEFLKYDRHLLVADVRFKEPCKPNDSSARSKRQKSYR